MRQILHAQDGKFETEASVQVYASRPGENRSVKHDPGLMVSTSYFVLPRISLGLGAGILSPYYTTTLVPVFGQMHAVIVSRQGLFLSGRIGEFIPMEPKNFKGGIFSEVSLGKDFKVGTDRKLRTSIGYSYQEMTATNQDNWWWGDSETVFEYNRIMLSLGWVF